MNTNTLAAHSSNTPRSQVHHKPKVFRSLSKQRRSFTIYRINEGKEENKDYHPRGNETEEERTSSKKSFRYSLAINAEKVKNNNKRWTAIYTITACATIGGFLFGYNTAIINGAIVVIEKEFEEMTEGWADTIIISTTASAAVCSIIAGILCDVFGRKKSIMISALAFAVGGFVAGIGHNLVTICLGRIVIGIGIGVTSTVVPIYVAECSPKENRGFFITIHQLMMTIGILVASIFAGTFQFMPNGWRIMLGVSTIPAIGQYVSFFNLPESPRYLVMKGEFYEAAEILRLLCEDDERAEQELNEIKSSLAWDPKIRTGFKAWKAVFTTVHVRKALLIGCSLQLFQQLTGINTVIYFSATILQSAGFESNNAIWLSLIPSTFNFLGTFIGLWAVERIGRKRLFAYSFFAVSLSCGILSSGFFVASMRSPATVNTIDPGSYGMCADFINCDTCLMLSENNCAYCAPTDNLEIHGSCINIVREGDHVFAKDGRCARNSSDHQVMRLMYGFCPATFSLVPLIGLILFMLSFSPGAGPMPWTINAEIFPLWARSVCCSITTLTNWVSNTAVSFAFTHLLKVVRGFGFFFIFLVLCIIAGIYISKLIPETKGQTLETIEYAFMDDDTKDDFMNEMVIQRLRSTKIRSLPILETEYEQESTEEDAEEEGNVDDIKELKRKKMAKRTDLPTSQKKSILARKSH